MNWDEKCVLELSHHNLFESTEQRSRFRDLVSCYCHYPFFNKGLCKCMYMFSWDEKHFNEILPMLNDMTIEGKNAPTLIADWGHREANELTGFDSEAYKLAVSFLTGGSYKLPDFSEMDADDAHVIRQTLLASVLIDELPDPHSGAAGRNYRQ